MKEELKAASWFTVGWFWIVALIIGASAIGVFFQPYFMKKETQNTRQSNGYITSKQVALTTFKADYDAIEVQLAKAKVSKDPAVKELITAYESQEAGIVRQMKQEAQFIPGNVPPEMSAFLATH